MYRFLLGGSQTASLAAIIASVIIQLDFYFGLLQLTGMRQAEAQVFDVQSAINPLLLVIGLYAQNTGLLRIGMLGQHAVIQVCSGEFHRKSVFLYHIVGVGKQEI